MVNISATTIPPSGVEEEPKMQGRGPLLLTVTPIRKISNLIVFEVEIIPSPVFDDVPVIASIDVAMRDANSDYGQKRLGWIEHPDSGFVPGQKSKKSWKQEFQNNVDNILRKGYFVSKENSEIFSVVSLGGYTCNVKSNFDVYEYLTPNTIMNNFVDYDKNNNVITLWKHNSRICDITKNQKGIVVRSKDYKQETQDLDEDIQIRTIDVRRNRQNQRIGGPVVDEDCEGKTTQKDCDSCHQSNYNTCWDKCKEDYKEHKDRTKLDKCKAKCQCEHGRGRMECFREHNPDRDDDGNFCCADRQTCNLYAKCGGEQDINYRRHCERVGEDACVDCSS